MLWRGVNRAWGGMGWLLGTGLHGMNRYRYLVYSIYIPVKR